MNLFVFQFLMNISIQEVFKHTKKTCPFPLWTTMKHHFWQRYFIPEVSEFDILGGPSDGIEKRFNSTLTNCYHNFSPPPLPPPKATNTSSIGKFINSTGKEKRDKTKMGVGNYFTVKVGETNEGINDVQIRSMRKDLVG